MTSGTSLLQAAIVADIKVKSVCGGEGRCGKCLGKIVDGLLTRPTAAEKEIFSPAEIREGNILLCQRNVLEDTTVEIESISDNHEILIQAKGDVGESFPHLDPLLTKTFHKLKSPSILDQTADLDRILELLPKNVTPDPCLLESLPAIVRESNFQVTSVVVDDRLIAVEKGDTTAESFGIALDMGTTTVAGYLVDMMSGRVVSSTAESNRQGIYGADVLSRIANTKKVPGGFAEIKKLVGLTVESIITTLLEEKGVSYERIYAVAAVGNTVMSHFMMGVPAQNIAKAPFIPAFTCSIRATLSDFISTPLPDRTRLFLLPGVAGYVGSDTVAMILATGIDKLAGAWLAIDIGTNGEIVLVSEGRILTCSAAAGPAFEGGCIYQGMRAEPGAISGVRIGEDVNLSVIGDIAPTGICGSGLVDAVSELARMNIVRGNGRIANPQDLPSSVSPQLKNRIERQSGVLAFVLVDGPNRVVITQKDINELLLAKAAIRAGAEILMEERGLNASDLEGVFLAGAFGSSLNSESIVGIGLLPNIEPDCIKIVGNAAGRGAIRALLSREELEHAEVLSHQIEHIELSTYEYFQKKFVEAIGLDQSD